MAHASRPRVAAGRATASACSTISRGDAGRGSQPVTPIERSCQASAACDRGCVKTPALRLHVENLSKFQQSEKKKHWRPLLGKDNRENYAARSSLVHVFTQAGPEAAIRLSYSMTSSARARIAGGIVRPSALAVLRLTTSSNVVGCWTGRSAGFVPLRMRPVYSPASRVIAVKLGP